MSLIPLTVCLFFPEIYVLGQNTTLHSNKSAAFEVYEYILKYLNPPKWERISFCLTDHVQITFRSPSRSGDLHLRGAPEFRTGIDRFLCQLIQSSAEVTVHLTLSQTESGPATYEKVSDCKKECEHDHLDETNRKSRSVSEGCSDIQERARENTVLVSGEKRIE